MSEKNRQKKDGERRDKKNKRMQASVEARRQTDPTPRQREKHEAKMTNTIPEGEARARKKGN